MAITSLVGIATSLTGWLINDIGGKTECFDVELAHHQERVDVSSFNNWGEQVVGSSLLVVKLKTHELLMGDSPLNQASYNLLHMPPISQNFALLAGGYRHDSLRVVAWNKVRHAGGFAHQWELRAAADVLSQDHLHDLRELIDQCEKSS